MPLNDFACDKCDYVEERYLKIDEVEGFSMKCPNCDEGTLRITFLKAPMGRMGGETSDRSIDSMKRSFRDRFVKKEIDDVRHKHGRLFDDSLRSAAATRIKKGEA